MSKELLVLCPFGLDAGLISKAVELSGGNVRILVPESEKNIAIHYGAAVIHLLHDCSIADETAFAESLASNIEQWGSQIIVAPATVQMRNVMSMLAWKLNAGLTADCTAIEMSSNDLIQTRPAFGNSLMATIRSLSNIQMATVRPGTYRSVERPNPNAQIILEQYRPQGSKVEQLSFVQFSHSKPLPQAQIIIAAGMGVGSKEGFRKLEQLASKLGAGIGASRSAVDAGFAPFHCQIGMTGVTVCPKIYIAVGISGAVQHLSGMSGSEMIIAINSDAKAPIFDYADYGIVGDWEVIVDKLLEEIL